VPGIAEVSHREGQERREQPGLALPDLKVVYMSWYTEEFSEMLHGAYFLQKPFSRDALLRQMQDALKGKPAEQADRPAFSLRIN